MLKKIQPIKSRQVNKPGIEGTGRTAAGGAHPRTRGSRRDSDRASGDHRRASPRPGSPGKRSRHRSFARRRAPPEGGKDSPRGSFFSLGRDGNARGADLTERGGRGLRCLPRSARASSIPPADWAEPRAAATPAPRGDARTRRSARASPHNTTRTRRRRSIAPSRRGRRPTRSATAPPPTASFDRRPGPPSPPRSPPTAGPSRRRTATTPSS